MFCSVSIRSCSINGNSRPFFSTYDRNGTYSQKRVMFHANTYKHIVRALFGAADCSRSKLKLPNCHATAPPHKRDVNLWLSEFWSFLLLRLPHSHHHQFALAQSTNPRPLQNNGSPSTLSKNRPFIFCKRHSQ